MSPSCKLKFGTIKSLIDRKQSWEVKKKKSVEWIWSQYTKGKDACLCVYVCTRVSSKRVSDKESRDLDYLSTFAITSLLLAVVPSTSNENKNKTPTLFYQKSRTSREN